MNQKSLSRRDICRGALLLGSALDCMSAAQDKAARSDGKFRPLFDGKSLKGWQPKARVLGKPSLGKWTVEDGVIVGGQDPPRVGSYLVSDEAFEDFELQVEARPDWPVDTGVLVRTVPQGNVGFQVNVDYRPHGCIGGYYGNGVGDFRAQPFFLNAEKDASGQVVRLVAEGTPDVPNIVPIEFAAPVEVFLKTWKIGEWNHFRIRSAGAMPYLTTWINGVKISELDTAKIKLPGYDPKEMLQRIGRSGHIALEVHDNDKRLGDDRWGPGKVCRWRNISVRNL